MKIAVIGGALQGVEVAYLARKAGIDVLLIDRRSSVPASGLCGTFRQADVNDDAALDREMADVDLIFPAIESQKALSSLHSWALRHEVPILHDPQAYAISASKLESERFFRKFGVPVPATWPKCRFPVIAKPSYGSGSQGIRLFASADELRHVMGDDPAAAGWIVQEFIEGPTYSVEVIRNHGTSTAVQVTDLYMDDRYDCKRVAAPSVLSAASQKELIGISLQMAENLDLEGIMDVEAVFSHGSFKVLEIDARFPSQTPIAVYFSCGINMVDVLVSDALGRNTASSLQQGHPARGVILEHIRVAPGSMVVTGEHAMAGGESLKLRRDFFGADEAITDYADGKGRWVATSICSGRNLNEAWERRNASVSNIRRQFNIDRYVDSQPSRFDPESTT
jgi:pyrrolysine biosynthesis protein PylC